MKLFVAISFVFVAAYAGDVRRDDKVHTSELIKFISLLIEFIH